MRCNLYPVVLVLSVVLGVVVALSGSLQAQPLIYEPFSQTAGGLNGQAGGTGLSGNWSDNQTVNVVNPPTLTYGDLANAGGQADMLNGNGVDAWITTSSVLGDNNLLNDGATLWFSTVFQKTSGGGSNEWAGFALGTDRLNAAYNGARMDGGYGLGFTTRSEGIRVSDWNFGNANQGGTLSVSYNTPTLIVGKIAWGANVGADETLSLYTPSLMDLGSLGTGVSKSFTGFDQSSLNTLSLTQRNSGGTQTYDEIRFGATLADVTPFTTSNDVIPEPTTLLIWSLLAGLGVGLGWRRRK